MDCDAITSEGSTQGHILTTLNTSVNANVSPINIQQLCTHRKWRRQTSQMTNVFHSLRCCFTSLQTKGGCDSITCCGKFFFTATSSSTGQSVVRSTQISHFLVLIVFSLGGWNLAWRSSVYVCVCVCVQRVCLCSCQLTKRWRSDGSGLFWKGA